MVVVKNVSDNEDKKDDGVNKRCLVGLSSKITHLV